MFLIEGNSLTSSDNVAGGSVIGFLNFSKLFDITCSGGSCDCGVAVFSPRNKKIVYYLIILFFYQKILIFYMH